MRRKAKTLEEIKQEINCYKEDLKYCTDGLNFIRFKHINKQQINFSDIYCVGESEVQLIWQNSIIKDLLKIIKQQTKVKK
jgi:hypothetical protein